MAGDLTPSNLRGAKIAYSVRLIDDFLGPNLEFGTAG